MTALWVYEGDVGVEITIQFLDAAGLPKDISDATVTDVYVRKASGAQVTWNAALGAGSTLPGDDGRIVYTTIAGDLVGPGCWDIQGYVEGPGYAYHGDKSRLVVRDALEGV